MKYLKTFESYSEKGLAQEIAEDILPKLQEIKKEKGIFTVGMFDNYMEERKGDMKLTDEVMSELVNMGFDFDDDDDDDFYFVEDDEYSVEYSDASDDLGKVRITVSERTQNVKNINCSAPYFSTKALIAFSLSVSPRINIITSCVIGSCIISVAPPS